MESNSETRYDSATLGKLDQERRAAIIEDGVFECNVRRYPVAVTIGLRGQRRKETGSEKETYQDGVRRVKNMVQIIRKRDTFQPGIAEIDGRVIPPPSADAPPSTVQQL